MTADNVLPFKPRPTVLAPEPNDPHTTGPMKCDACGHEELVVVSPCGRKYFECFKCHVMAMRRNGPVLPRDGVWRQSCPDCKGQTFAIMPNLFMCSDCGTTLKTDWTGTG